MVTYMKPLGDQSQILGGTSRQMGNESVYYGGCPIKVATREDNSV